MPRTRRGLTPPLALLFALLGGGCDAVETPPPIGAPPPTVEALTLAPPLVAADTLAIQADSLSVPLRLTVRARPGDAPLARVAYSVRWQFACVEGTVEKAGRMEDSGDGVFLAAPVLRLPPGRRGAFRVTAYAVSADGQASNEAVATLTLRAPNAGPPVITQVEAPAQLRIPASGAATLRFRVTVADPDGLDHIARAEVEAPGVGTFPLAHTDDQANRTPCDGVFSVAFAIPAGSEPGTLPFVFRAYDRDGAASDPFPFAVALVQ